MKLIQGRDNRFCSVYYFIVNRPIFNKNRFKKCLPISENIIDYISQEIGPSFF